MTLGSGPGGGSAAPQSAIRRCRDTGSVCARPAPPLPLGAVPTDPPRLPACWSLAQSVNGGNRGRRTPVRTPAGDWTVGGRKRLVFLLLFSAPAMPPAALAGLSSRTTGCRRPPFPRCLSPISPGLPRHSLPCSSSRAKEPDAVSNSGGSVGGLPGSPCTCPCHHSHGPARAPPPQPDWDGRKLADHLLRLVCSLDP